MVLPLLKLTLPRDIQPIHPALLPASLFFNCNVITQIWFLSLRSLYLVLRWWPWCTALVAEPANPRNFCRHSTGTSSETNPPVGAQPRLKQYECEPNLKLPLVSVKDVEKSWNRKKVCCIAYQRRLCGSTMILNSVWRLPPRQWYWNIVFKT